MKEMLLGPYSPMTRDANVQQGSGTSCKRGAFSFTAATSLGEG